MKSIFTILSILLLGLSACQDDPKPTTSTAALAATDNVPVTIEYETFEARSPSCVSDTVNCAVIKLNYPVFKGPAPRTTAMNDTIEGTIIEMLSVMNAPSAPLPLSVSAAADSFLQAYVTYREDAPNELPVWTVELDGEVIFERNELVSIVLNHYSYAGGAHPNGYNVFYTFDTETGEVIQLDKAINDLNGLAAVAEQAFRKTRGLDPDKTFADSEFFWEGEFKFPENYAFLENSLVFFYNPYEVAAYAAGPTEFELPYSEIQQFLNPELKLQLGIAESL